MIPRYPQDGVMATRHTYTLRELTVYVGVWALAIAIYVPFARRLNLPWWSIFAVAAFGAFVGFFSGQGGRLLNPSIGIWASVFAVLAIPVFGIVGIIILGQFTFGGDFQLKDVSYDTYRRRVDVSRIDPRGAEEIHFFEHVRKDYRVSFWKMSIDSGHYQRLLDSRKQFLSAEMPSCSLQESDIEIVVLTEFISDCPEWWRLPRYETELSVHTVQCDDGRGIKTYIRGMWVYDEVSATLWIVEK